MSADTPPDAGNALQEAAAAVLAFWDSLDAVPGDDQRETAEFAAEMDSRLFKLRAAVEALSSGAARPEQREPSDRVEEIRQRWADITDNAVIVFSREDIAFLLGELARPPTDTGARHE